MPYNDFPCSWYLPDVRIRFFRPRVMTKILVCFQSFLCDIIVLKRIFRLVWNGIGEIALDWLCGEIQIPGIRKIPRSGEPDHGFAIIKRRSNRILVVIIYFSIFDIFGFNEWFCFDTLFYSTVKRCLGSLQSLKNKLQIYVSKSTLKIFSTFYGKKVD